MKKLEKEFFSRDAITVAQELLGKVLVHELDGITLRAKIVETEAYAGVTDKASHSYGGRRTDRVEVMYGEAGVSYVYLIYGMHNCFNVVVAEKEDPQAVLIRALEPLEGHEKISDLRYKKSYESLNKRQILGLTNGPGKLCKGMAIDKGLNGLDLSGDKLYIEDGNSGFDIVSAKRVGIDFAEEAKDFPWRFYIKGNPYVSVK